MSRKGCRVANGQKAREHSYVTLHFILYTGCSRPRTAGAPRAHGAVPAVQPAAGHAHLPREHTEAPRLQETTRRAPAESSRRGGECEHVT